MRPIASRHSLKTTLHHLQGKKSPIRREIEALLALLVQTGQEGRFSSLLMKSVLFAGMGAIVGLLLQNPAAAPLLASLGLFLPVWSLKLYSIRYNRHLSSKLESTLALVTASFIRNNNLTVAVSENLNYMDPLLKTVFEEFLAESKFNADLEACIQNLSRKIHHSVMAEWCVALIKACQNSALKEDLVLIVSKLSSIRIVQENLDTETREILTQYILMLFILVFTIPLIYLVNREWFFYFFTHPLGRFAVAFGLFALIFGISSIVRCSNPVRYG